MDIEELYKKIFYSCVQFAVYQKKDIIENVKQLLPLLNNFANEFLRANGFELEEEDYQQLKQLLLNILNDIAQGMEQRDTVLLEDTIEFGLKEFVEMFIPDEQELKRLREESVSE